MTSSGVSLTVSENAKRTEQGAIAQEILRFLRGPGAHSLIVKGPAGTGKTTFVVQIAEALGFPLVFGESYISIRVSAESLLKLYPSMRRPATEGHKDANEAFEREERPPRGELRKLTGETENPLPPDELVFETFPELVKIYESVKGVVRRTWPIPALVVIDSIDALAQHYDVEKSAFMESKIMNALQRDLVESGCANIVYVLEKSGATLLDYMGDGVLNLSSTEHRGRRLRVMTIEKLRGQEIRQPRYLYTLDKGRLTTFEAFHWNKPPTPRLWSPIVDDGSGGSIGSGLPEVDRLFGGLAPGRVVVIKVSNGVPTEVVDGLRIAMICNFASQGRGVAHIPPGKGTTEQVREIVGPHLPTSAFDAHVRVLEVAPATGELAKNAILIEGRWNWAKIEFEFNLSKSKKPVLALVSLDTLEALYGASRAMEEMSHVLASVRKSRDTLIVLVPSESEAAGQLSSLANAVLNLEEIDGTVVLHGDKPYTGLFSLSFDWSSGTPDAKLHPIV
jgi:KaiC/GvpD/RAD55 family RecA-like ATPase